MRTGHRSRGGQEQRPGCWEGGGDHQGTHEVSHAGTGAEAGRSSVSEDRCPGAKDRTRGQRGPQMVAQAPIGPRFKRGKKRLAAKSNREKLLFEEPGRETLSSGHHQPDFVPAQRSAMQTRYQGAPPSSSSGGGQDTPVRQSLLIFQ